MGNKIFLEDWKEIILEMTDGDCNPSIKKTPEMLLFKI
jgi:hypothetical protein